MLKNLLFLVVALVSLSGYGQVVINELDSDTPGTDVKEFVELKSSTANFSLDGFVLVFFNGGSSPYSGTSSYFAVDLDGKVTDGNGIFLLGNSQVVPSPSYIFPLNTIQNGPDAVAIYLGDAADFPANTPATATNLIDALAYSTNTTSAANLMSILGETVSYNENANSSKDAQSIQRKADGTYEVKNSTPRVNNDGSGIIYNGITTTFTPSAPLIEGKSVTVTFTTETNVPSDLNFLITLNNGTFTSTDFSGNLNITIAAGSNTTSTIIQLLNDGINEGDENMLVSIGTVPSGYIILNNSIYLRVNDINFQVSAWGTPLNPTYGSVASTVPAGYYASLEGKSGAVLKQAIQDIIANPAEVREHNYGDAYDILKDADQNPENSSEVWLLYLEKPRSKLDSQTGASGAVGYWNREHIYPQSRGGFTDATSSTPNGIDIWSPTDADDIAAGHSDVHHIRVADSPENSLRSNRNYGVDYKGPLGTKGSWHGDVARAIFYMTVRYNGLNVVDGNVPENPDGFIGDLTTLLEWNRTDTSDDFEMNRNNVVYNWQKNRNPFIDYPELVEYIWGAKIGQTWSATLSTVDNSKLYQSIYPNPAKDHITISGYNEPSSIVIYNIFGAKLFQSDFTGDTKIKLNLEPGMYLTKITSDNKSTISKLIIQ